LKPKLSKDDLGEKNVQILIRHPNTKLNMQFTDYQYLN